MRILPYRTVQPRGTNQFNCHLVFLFIYLVAVFKKQTHKSSTADHGAYNNKIIK